MTFRQFLKQKADAGNSDAAYALKFMGDDGKINANWVVLEDNARQNPNQQYSDYLLNKGSAMRGFSTEFRNSQDSAPSDGGGGGGGYSEPAKTLDTSQIQSLDSLIKSLETMKDRGVEKAKIKRDTSLREKEEEKEREKGKYEGKKLSTLQDFGSAKTDTDINTRNTLENLISSLSTLGLGGSRALTRQLLDAANISNRKANVTQATNNRELDGSWNEYTSGYETDIDKIKDQFGYDEGEAVRKYLQDKQNALYKKADVYNAADRASERDSIMNEANSLNPKIAGADFINPRYTGQKRELATPELGDYAQDIARYDTTKIQGANAPEVTPVASDGMNTPGNLAVRAIAVNDKDLGIKKKAENDLGYGV